MEYENNIKKLGILIPDAPNPVGSYVAYKIVNKFLYISGQISLNFKGKLGKDISIEDGQEAAKQCAISIIAQIKQVCGGDLSKIKSCIKITGFVNSTEDFTEQPKVINGASDFITSIFGDNGKHARAAISSNSLPLGVSVEVDAIFELN